MSEQSRSVRAADIFITLKQRILSWAYPPGHRFTEEEICKEFGVSRSPVRETLRMLEENGLVDKVPYRGCTVKQPDLDEINELYDVRVILESAVVEYLSIHGMPPEVHVNLMHTWECLLQLPVHSEVDSVDLADQDRVFHETLARATGNRTLADLLHGINDRLHFIRMTDITDVKRLWETCTQHIQVLEGIASGDVASAQSAMRVNIEGARSHVKTAIAEALVEAYMGHSTPDVKVAR